MCAVSGWKKACIKVYSDPTSFISYRKWESDKVLSFVPPDGQFKLMSYRYEWDAREVGIS